MFKYFPTVQAFWKVWLVFAYERFKLIIIEDGSRFSRQKEPAEVCGNCLRSRGRSLHTLWHTAIQQEQESRHKQVIMSKTKRNATAYVFFFPGILLFVLAASLRLLVNIHHAGTLLQSPVNAGRSTDVVAGAALSQLPKVPKQEASIIVVVTSKASSTARRSWLRGQL
jgi:hypothetical protein